MSLKKLFLASAAFTLVLAAYSSPASSTSCPPPRPYNDVCITVIVWAKDPQSGICCQYPTPCSAPDGWEIFYGPNCTNPEIEGL
jgi:hypothetical protein